MTVAVGDAAARSRASPWPPAAPRPLPPQPRQLIAVDAASRRTTYASVRLWQRHGDCWSPSPGPWTARVGRNGLSAHHREGDGTTPTGVFALDDTVYGSRPDPGVRYRYHRIVCGDWWDEDASSPTYNTSSTSAAAAGRRSTPRAKGSGKRRPPTAT